jgi:hypothetical protein
MLTPTREPRLYCKGNSTYISTQLSISTALSMVGMRKGRPADGLFLLDRGDGTKKVGNYWGSPGVLEGIENLISPIEMFPILGKTEPEMFPILGKTEPNGTGGVYGY